ncbi:hypothetical protein Acr_24g0010880 [Actinidia rufa]|uniref:Uncharacterized protein n=1 Tax=Actinidia rufa TaxID=165716 RepID=A0A7J0GVU7_9ERIC|nr:hypothetical protein Acr_24g0010880 [Actinidia rufa]
MEDETEETLSFCDLPIYSDDSGEWENFSKEDQSLSSSSLSSSDQDLFEFFSPDWTNSSTKNPLPNIVFCGKLIPFKEPISDTHKNPETNKQQKPKNRGFFRWNLKFFSKREATKPSSTKGYSTNKSNKTKSRHVSGSKHGFSVRRVSILSSPVKPRWQHMMFGLARFPAGEMELREMRSRQSRQSPSALFRLNSGGGQKVHRVQGLLGLIRSLGCGGRHQHHVNAVVRA